MNVFRVVRIALSLAVFCGAVASPASSPAGPGGKLVRALGMGAGTDLKAKDEARQDARRRAVEKACGVVINAYSKVEDFELKKDRIMTNAVGYLTSEKVIREWNENDLSYCEISANVSTGQFKADWDSMFTHLREDMQNPRCIVVITEDNDVDDSNPAKVHGVVQSTIEHYFLNHDVQLMDKGVTEDVKDRDIELAASAHDLTALAARAASFGADVLVFGQAEARRGGMMQLGIQTLRKWDITLNVRVVQADSGRILASNVYNPSKPFTSTSTSSGDSGFKKLADDASEKILKDIAAAWQKAATSHRIVRLILEGCSRSDFRKKIAPALLKVRGVQSGDDGVKLREVVNNIVTAEVDWAFELDVMADTLEDLDVPGFRFTIVEQSSNRIRAKVIQTP